MQKSVSFIFNNTYPFPTGGPKVVFEYANRLVKDGWKVYIVYNYLVKPSRFLSKIYHFFYDRIKFYINRRKGIYPSARNWFNLDARVNEVYVPKLSYSLIPKTDLYVATALSTAKYVCEFPVLDKNKFYIIQDYEKWAGRTDRDVRETYRYPMNKIVISKWLKDIVNEEGQECTLVPNGFDFTYFTLNNPVEYRNRYCISMMYHVSSRKGCSIAFKALDIVKERFPQLEVMLFGAYKKPKGLPEWYTYTQTPTREEHNNIYNSSSIYVSASETEGWGLTVGEAMICGAAVVCTANQGFCEMVVDGQTGLLCRANEVLDFAENIIRLIENNDLRIHLAKNGNEYIKKFSWDNSYAIINKMFMSSCR